MFKRTTDVNGAVKVTVSHEFCKTCWREGVTEAETYGLDGAEANERAVWLLIQGDGTRENIVFHVCDTPNSCECDGNHEDEEEDEEEEEEEDDN